MSLFLFAVLGWALAGLFLLGALIMWRDHLAWRASMVRWEHAMKAHEVAVKPHEAELWIASEKGGAK